MKRERENLLARFCGHFFGALFGHVSSPIFTIYGDPSVPDLAASLPCARRIVQADKIPQYGASYMSVA